MSGVIDEIELLGEGTFVVVGILEYNRVIPKLPDITGIAAPEDGIGHLAGIEVEMAVIAVTAVGIDAEGINAAVRIDP